MAQSAPGQSSSVDLELALLQNRAVRVYAAALELRAQAATAAVRNRQAGVAARRRIDVLRRQHQALMGRAAERLVDARRTSATGGRVPTRVVVAHRDGRFVADLQAELAKLGHLVVASTDNGADAIGITVAEQPDVLLVDDSLLMLSGEQVVRDVRVYSPGALVAAQVPDSSRVQRLLEAGARAVFPETVPAVDVARELVVLAAFPTKG
jgi:CheY-like chemotaxis protein